MSSFFVTVLIAFAVLLIALVLLGIGWLLSGKVRIVRGACGMDPTKLRKKSCDSGVQCQLCEKPPSDSKQEKDTE